PDRWHFMASELKKYSRGEHPPLEEWLNHPPPDPSAVRDPLEPSSLEGSDSIERIFTLGPRSFVYQFFDMELHADGTRHIGLMMREVTEERKLRQQLERADKLSGLGTLAAGIAHEMNNPLNSIMGFSEMIQDKKCPPEIKALAGKIFKRSKHMASIILNLTDYSRFDPKDEPAPLHLCEQLDSVVEMALMASFSDDIVLKKNYSPMPPFEAKPEEIQQIFLNIIVNAVQAMEGRGELILSAGMQNGKIEIRIQDSGPGIPKEFLPKIFDPFFTSKTQGKGTGLGLNIVHRLVQKYGGRVDAHSEIGKGTTFVISLPVRP
ncbi:MAG: GHKL domain-containing protein, partial [Nitrospinaceae bacterium]|nr:GHKL domain-containing protein [Nitrospinaceae bacterium]NIR54774.1 GHKL domain-containing protein [Nitrospinaceae bacterium]NIU44274.1 GHKL domain-containing protein [Nitrospinaceae bacterium]NIY15216.1 GHKL domain-containing protein [Nitrospinaceae bacterium]